MGGWIWFQDVSFEGASIEFGVFDEEIIFRHGRWKALKFGPNDVGAVIRNEENKVAFDVKHEGIRIRIESCDREIMMDINEFLRKNSKNRSIISVGV